MSRSKVMSYLGFAAKSRNIITGYNTCIMAMEKNKIRFLIIAEDLSENTLKKITKQCIKNNVSYRIFGKIDELSHITGKSDKGLFGIVDDNFSKIICKEIDLIQSEKEVF